ncbi:50S ribosomal protein L13 [Clostridia bacterium]|nr:50S ribosomal protein L13 [Clostridia bacterium]
MSTCMLKKEDVQRKWYVIDAANRPLGRLAVEVARLLMGKHRPDYTPHVDCGDHVIVLNAAKVALTGRKLEQKVYRYHTGWVGGLKEIGYKTLMVKEPEKAVKLAVAGMLPKNSIGRQSLTRLRVFAREQHRHTAQKPKPISVA